MLTIELKNKNTLSYFKESVTFRYTDHIIKKEINEIIDETIDNSTCAFFQKK